MADSRARDILSRQTQLEQVRQHYEGVWRDVAEYCAPDAPEFTRYGFSSLAGADNQAARSDRRARRVYDGTVRQGQRRLTAGLESLITPQNEKWHGLTTAAFDDEETDEEKEWAESVRDFQFTIRYSPSSGFVPALQSCYANIVRFGPAYLYCEEDNSGRHIRYRSLPVSEVWTARNRWGETDTLHRKYKRTARQLAQEFGAKLPQKIRDAADDPKKCDEQFEIVHAIYPANDRERGAYRLGGTDIYLDGPFKSCHVLVGEETIIKERSFRSFPVACFAWNREDGDEYGTSPVIELLTEVREINVVRKGALRALQQVTDPPLGLGGKVDWTPPLDPGSRHPGIIDEQGRLMVQPIVTGMRPDYAFQYIERSQQTISEGLYVNLFQVLVSKPSQQTATEALIRQEEKGALLGPAGSSIQSGLAMLVDRELSILEAQGLYEPDSRFVPPESLWSGGRPIRVNFSSPIDVLRKAGEARAVVENVALAAQWAQVLPEVLDNVDINESYRTVVSAGRAPQKTIRRKEEVEEKRKQDAEAARVQQGMAAMSAAAGIAKDAVPAMAQASEAGFLQNLGITPPQ